jgi:hypothetical protein
MHDPRREMHDPPNEMHDPRREMHDPPNEMHDPRREMPDQNAVEKIFSDCEPMTWLDRARARRDGGTHPASRGRARESLIINIPSLKPNKPKPKPESLSSALQVALGAFAPRAVEQQRQRIAARLVAEVGDEQFSRRVAERAATAVVEGCWRESELWHLVARAKQRQAQGSVQTSLRQYVIAALRNELLRRGAWDHPP